MYSICTCIFHFQWYFLWTKPDFIWPKFQDYIFLVYSPKKEPSTWRIIPFSKWPFHGLEIGVTTYLLTGGPSSKYILTAGVLAIIDSTKNCVTLPSFLQKKKTCQRLLECNPESLLPDGHRARGAFCGKHLGESKVTGCLTGYRAIVGLVISATLKDQRGHLYKHPKKGRVPAELLGSRCFSCGWELAFWRLWRFPLTYRKIA